MYDGPATSERHKLLLLLSRLAEIRQDRRQRAEDRRRIRSRVHAAARRCRARLQDLDHDLAQP